MSVNDDGYIRAWHRSVPVSINPLVPMPKLVGLLTATGTGPWAKINDVPSAYYAQLTGTSGACTATAHFEFGDDIPGTGGVGQTGVAPAGVGTTISLSGTGAGGNTGSSSPQPAPYVGTGMFGADASVSPLVPWKYCRLVVTAISGTGAQVAGFQNLGGV